MIYFRTPKYAVALNAKVGSSSLARAIIRQFFPKQDWLIRTAAFPQGVDETKRQWHRMCPGTRKPTKPVVLLVRDPVERFLSAMQQVGLKQKDVDAAIDSLVNDTPVGERRRTRGIDGKQREAIVPRDTPRARRRRERMARRGAKPARPGRLRDDIHFAKQSDYVCGETHLFRFPAHLAQAATMIGLEGELPKANAARRQKPTLTPEQEAAVRGYYAADQSLWESIVQPGTVVRPAAAN